MLVLGVEVAPHRPLAGHLGGRARRASRRVVDVIDQLAGRLREVGVAASPRARRAPARCDRRGRSGPRRRAATAGRPPRPRPGAPCSEATSVRRPAGSCGDRVRPGGRRRRRLGAGLREVAAQLVADLLRGRPLRLPPRTRQRARQGERQRRRQQDHHQPARASRAGGAGPRSGRGGRATARRACCAAAVRWRWRGVRSLS